MTPSDDLFAGSDAALISLTEEIVSHLLGFTPASWSIGEAVVCDFGGPLDPPQRSSCTTPSVPTLFNPDVEGLAGLESFSFRQAIDCKHSVGVLSGTCWWHGVMTDRADARRCWWRAGFGQAGAAWSGGIQGSPMIA